MHTVPVTMKVEGREEIKTTLGTFKTLRVQPTADAGVVKNRGNIWIWYTDDERHLPVQMRARLFWGTITFRLTGNERPMTFEDMMKMKRLGETAVSPDGKWLAYSVTTVDLDGPEHEDGGAVAAGDCGRRAVQDCCGQPGDSGVQFSADGRLRSVSFGREGGPAGLGGGL
jgi:hypothetical protein